MTENLNDERLKELFYCCDLMKHDCEYIGIYNYNIYE